MVNTDFTNFGVNKIIIITALIDGYQYNLHPNTILTNNTTFEEYYSPFSLLPSPLRVGAGLGQLKNILINTTLIRIVICLQS